MVVPYGQNLSAEPFSQVAPDTSGHTLGMRYQHIQADADSFGGGAAKGMGQIAGGLDALAKGLKEFEDQKSNIDAHRAMNQMRQYDTTLLHGDPNKTVPGPDGKPAPDMGLLGMNGEQAMTGVRTAAQSRDAYLQSLTQGLSPKARLRFEQMVGPHDAQIRGALGSKYHHAFNQYAETTESATLDVAMGDLSAATLEGDAAKADAARNLIKQIKIQRAERTTSGNHAAILAANRDADQTALILQINAVGTRDPVEALRLTRENVGTIGDKAPAMLNHWGPHAAAAVAVRETDDAFDGAQVRPAAQVSAGAAPNIATAVREAGAMGVDPVLALTAYNIESSYGTARDMDARSNKGAFQLNQENVERLGVVWEDYLDDHDLQIRTGLRYLKNQVAAARTALPSGAADPEPWQVYLTHQQGGGGAAALFRADRGESAEEVLGRLKWYQGGKHGTAHDAIYGNLYGEIKRRPDVTVGEFLDYWRGVYAGKEAEARQHLVAAPPAKSDTPGPAVPATAPTPATPPEAAPAQVPAAPVAAEGAKPPSGEVPIAPGVLPVPSVEEVRAKVEAKLRPLNLSPEQMSHALDQAVQHRNKRVSVFAAQVQEWDGVFKDRAEKQASGGENVRPPDWAALDRRVTPEKLAEYKDQWANATNQGRYTRIIRGAPATDVQAMMSDLQAKMADPRADNFSEHAKNYKALQAALAARQKALTEDAASYARAFDAGTQQAYAAAAALPANDPGKLAAMQRADAVSIRAQHALIGDNTSVNAPVARVLSVVEAEELVNKATNTPPSEMSMPDFVGGLRMRYGENFAQVWNELRAAKMPDDVHFAGAMGKGPDSLVAADVAYRMIQFTQEVRGERPGTVRDLAENLRARSGSPYSATQLRTDAQAAAGAALANWVAVLRTYPTDASLPSSLARLDSFVTNFALYAAAVNPDVNLKQGAKLAVRAVLDANYDIGGGVITPKGKMEQFRQGQQALSAYLNPNVIENIPATAMDAGSTQESRNAAIVRAVQNAAAWTLTPDQRGMQLNYGLRSGLPQPLVSKDGVPIRFDFADVPRIKADPQAYFAARYLPRSGPALMSQPYTPQDIPAIPGAQ